MQDPITISGNMRVVRTAKPGDLAYMVEIGHVPLCRHIADHFNGGFYCDIKLYSDKRKNIHLMGQLDVYRCKKEISYYRNGWKLSTDTEEEICVLLGKERLEKCVAKFFQSELTRTNNWHESGWWDLVIEVKW